MTPSPRRSESRAAFVRTSPAPVVCLLAALVSLPTGALGQERQASPTISSDRPGLGDGAWVLAPGVWQVEIGGTLQSVPNDHYLVGSSLVRVGLSSLELRVYVPDVVSQRQGDFLRLGDLGVGAKIPLDLGGEGWRWGVEGAATLPTGSASVSAGDATASATMLAETDLGDGVVLALNMGYGFVFSDSGSGVFSLLATPSFPVPGKEGLSAYAGYAGYYGRGDDAHYVEGGVYKLDGADRQWDVNAGYDPNGHVWFLGVGMAQRWR